MTLIDFQKGARYRFRINTYPGRGGGKHLVHDYEYIQSLPQYHMFRRVGVGYVETFTPAQLIDVKIEPVV